MQQPLLLLLPGKLFVKPDIELCGAVPAEVIFHCIGNKLCPGRLVLVVFICSAYGVEHIVSVIGLECESVAVFTACVSSCAAAHPAASADEANYEEGVEQRGDEPAKRKRNAPAAQGAGRVEEDGGRPDEAN